MSLLTAKQIAEEFGIHTYSALNQAAYRKDGPPFYKIGRKRYYDPQEYHDWCRKDRVDHNHEKPVTVEEAGPKDIRPRLTARKKRNQK